MIPKSRIMEKLQVNIYSIALCWLETSQAFNLSLFLSSAFENLIKAGLVFLYLLICKMHLFSYVDNDNLYEKLLYHYLIYIPGKSNRGWKGRLQIFFSTLSIFEIHRKMFYPSFWKLGASVFTSKFFFENHSDQPQKMSSSYLC